MKLAKGTPVRVVEGPYKDLDARVETDRGTRVDLKVLLFGREVNVTVNRSQLGDVPDSVSMDDILAEVENAVMMRGHGLRIAFWWARRAKERRYADEELLSLEEPWKAFSTALYERLDEERAEALEAARDAFKDLPDDERTNKWFTELDIWTNTGEHVRRVRDELDAEGTLETDELTEGTRLESRFLEAKKKRDRDTRPLDDLSDTEPIAENEALFAALERDPNNREAFLVYADYLQSEEDPRGELIALQAAGRKLDANRLLQKHERYFVGNLWLYPVLLDWKMGFIEWARIAVKREHEDQGVRQGAMLKTLLQLPSARLLRELVLGAPSIHEDVLDEMLEALWSEAPRPLLRSLEYITFEDEEMLSWTETGDLSPLSAHYPNLERLVLHAGSITLGPLDLPELRELALKSCHLTRKEVDAVMQATFPRLERLCLWFGSAEQGAHGSVEGMGRLFSGELAPELTDLTLANNDFTDEIVAELVASPILPQLERLDLSMGTLSDEGAAVLLEHQERMKSLRYLGVKESFLTDEALGGICEEVDFGGWQRRDEDYGGRYASIWE